MAGDWIKFRTSLPRDPRVVRISSALKADRLRTIGGLASAWCLFDEQTEAGFLDGYTPELLDELVGLPGLARAMESVGWLVIGDGFLEIPRFEEHNGQSAKRRAQDNVRKKSAREADKCPQTKRTECGPEKRREENIEGSHNAREPEGVSPSSPTLAEIQGYAARNMIAADVATAFYDSMEAVGWLDAKGRAIKSPEHALKRWAANWAEIKARTPAARSAAPETKQPFDPAKGFWQQGTPSQIRERERAEREARAKEEVA